MICWAKENPYRVRARFRFIIEHFDWFMKLRDIRDDLVHRGYSLVPYTDRITLRYFFVDPGENELRMLHGGYREEDVPDPDANYPKPLLPLLKKFTLHVFELATQLSEAIQDHLGIKASKTHTLNGVYVPALHHLLSYEPPIERHLLTKLDKLRLDVSAWYLLDARHYLTAIERGYPDGFWWKFLIRLSELFMVSPYFMFDPIYGERGILARWQVVFLAKGHKYGFWLRDGILLEKDWLEREKARVDAFATTADTCGTVLVANRVGVPDDEKMIADAPANFIVEDDPIFAAETAFKALTLPIPDEKN